MTLIERDGRPTQSCSNALDIFSAINFDGGEDHDT